jgi:FtsH-binding integral membrane protein
MPNDMNNPASADSENEVRLWRRLVLILPIYVAASAVTLATATNGASVGAWLIEVAALGAAVWLLVERRTISQKGLGKMRFGWMLCCIFAAGAILAHGATGRELRLPIMIGAQALVPFLMGR